MRTATETVNVRAARAAKKDTLTIAGIPFLTIELDTMENFQKNVSCVNTGKKSTDQKSASNRMKDCLGTCTVSLVVLPFTLRRTGLWLAAEIAMVADRVTAVGLYKMKFSCRGGNSFARAASKRSRFNSISSRSLTCPSASNIKYIQIDSPAP